MIDQEKIDELKQRQPLNFSEALEMMKFNLKVRRTGWKIPKLDFVKIKKPTSANDGSSRDACFSDYFGKEFQLTAIDILSDDWVIVD